MTGADEFEGHTTVIQVDGKDRIYHVPELWKATKDIEPSKPNLRKLKWLLKKKIWGRRVKNPEGFFEGTHTPEDVLMKRLSNKEIKPMKPGDEE